MSRQDPIGGMDITGALAALRPWQDVAADISAEEYQERLQRARGLMREQAIDAVFITAGASLRYFSGVPWSASERLVGLLLTADGAPLLICPAFERGSLTPVLRIPAELRLWQEHDNPHALVATALRERGADNLALDPAAPFSVANQLAAVMGKRPLVDASRVVNGCRMCKSDAELALMKQATAMTLEVHRLVASVVHEGVSNRQLVRFIDDAHRALGADNGSTFCIVQFGLATAYPHGLPGEQFLVRNELVLVDTGCSVHGYNSDITRCYPFGQPTTEQRRIWELERAAQQAAFDAVRPGVSCEAVDAAVRRTLEAAGLGPGYELPGVPHRTGHGCGLSIHEAPYLVRGDSTVLQPGMCCSNEPMIVVPDSFGVRLEDHFYVTAHGAAWFTEPSPAIDQPFA